MKARCAAQSAPSDPIALVAGDDFARGVRLAVNHAGDSDSTGAITGNILGALMGEEAIPGAWLKRLEVHVVVLQVGEDLFDTFQGTAAWLKRYPTSNHSIC